MLLTERQKLIFRLAIEGHIASGEPISSDWLVAHLPERISSATVRNELLELENKNLLRQPHTSAGRVPTEKGYRFYIETFVQPADCSAEMQSIEGALEKSTDTERYRQAARELAAATNNVVLVGLNDGTVFVTGLSRLFSEPEAHNLSVLQQLATAFDQPDELLVELRAVMNDDVKILLGRQNPVDAHCALLLTRCQDETGEYPMAMFGFMRMRYDRNIALMNAMKNLLES